MWADALLATLHLQVGLPAGHLCAHPENIKIKVKVQIKISKKTPKKFLVYFDASLQVFVCVSSCSTWHDISSKLSKAAVVVIKGHRSHKENKEERKSGIIIGEILIGPLDRRLIVNLNHTRDR